MQLNQTHELECDVLVAGGGPAGVPAALAAARNGANVILIQDRPVLGGNASSEIRMHIVGADQSGGRSRGEADMEVREGGIIEEVRLTTSVTNPQRSANMLDLVLYDLCINEPHLKLMLNTRVVDAEVRNNLITHAIARRDSTEDEFRIAARIFIDCTGDGALAASAGAPFYRGREDQKAFNEKYARETADKQTLGSSLLFTARKHDRPMPFVAPRWVRKFKKEDFKFRGIPKGSYEYGYWWVEWGGQIDTIKDNEKIRDELMAIMLGCWNYIKNSGDHPDSANWALDFFGWVPGKRESRRFIGQHTLTQADVEESKPCDDAIAYGGWAMDLHPPSGVDVPDEKPFIPYHVPNLYSIPLRCCVSREVRNLMFAGRNISASHVAFGSTRVMATCAVVGEGAGTAAAFAVKNRLHPAQLAENKAVMRAIQQQLLRQDAYLVGVKNEDSADLAPKAKITASSEQKDSPAQNVVSGQTRSVHGKRGAPADRAFPGTHRWKSEPAEGMPQWLELRWDKVIRPAEVQLVFDTGLQRPLTLSQDDRYTARMTWGRPQPETIRDYVIEGEAGGKWVTLATVKDNYLRRRVHKITSKDSISAIRITVISTNGLDHARIMEVRVYEV